MWWIVFLLALSGCGGKLVEDPSISALEANYPTAEIYLNGKVAHGLAVGSVGSELQIQGYGTGEIKVDGQTCGVEFNKSYSLNERVSIPLPQVDPISAKSCLLDVLVTPHYKEQDNAAIKVYPFKGIVALKESKPSVSRFTRKLTGNMKSTLHINVGGTGSVKYIFTGCGLKVTGDAPLSEGYLDLDTANLVNMKTGTSCVLEGIVISPEYEDMFVTVLISAYSPLFTPLSEPSIAVKDKSLEIEGDSAVSIVSLDSEFKIGNTGKFDLNPNGNQVIRLITNKGRSVIGTKQEGSWQWIR